MKTLEEMIIGQMPEGIEYMWEDYQRILEERGMDEIDED